ncbi:MAG TPA: response regulator transcription factor [Puia sp.]|nr:response regulator transcription factor [Puia sp.]
MIKILLADDHAAIRKRLRQILLEGFPDSEIAEVADGNRLVRRSLEGSWDIVIADIAMPVLSGLEALRRIRVQFPRLPVLLVSIYFEEDFARFAVAAGASAYLCKEKAQEDLLPIVRSLIV